jgi:hypothetical protein
MSRTMLVEISWFVALRHVRQEAQNIALFPNPQLGQASDHGVVLDGRCADAVVPGGGAWHVELAGLPSRPPAPGPTYQCAPRMPGTRLRQRSQTFWKEVSRSGM